MNKRKCIMILSDKSSGSSALQKELSKSKQVNIIKYTRHNEHETLYWNKAVAVLGFPQEEIKYSELPMTAERAEKDLRTFFKKNLPNWQINDLTKEALFDGWGRLCDEYGPILLEKSPHHLHYWSALELVIEMMNRSSVNFLFLGLVRNPMDSLYSSWKRWSAVPEKNQFEWLRAYNNLLKFKKIVGERMKIVNYETIVSDKTMIKTICEFIGIKDDKNIGSGFHLKSIQKWRADIWYGFQLSDDVRSLANSFGYEDNDLDNHSSKLWPIYKHISDIVNRIKRQLWSMYRKKN